MSGSNQSESSVLSLLVKAALKSNSKGALIGSHDLVLPTEPLEQELQANIAQIEQFHSVVGWSSKKYLHPCVPHIMAFKLHLRLMLNKDFPFALLGLVHIENELRQERPILINEVLRIRCSLEKLKQHRKGWVFAIRTEIRAEDGLIWQSSSNNLFRTNRYSDGTKPLPDLAEITDGQGESWQLAGNLGRQYAKSAGDYNPIHLHPLSAKMFGFKRHIVHGMWSKARCLSAFEPYTGDAFSCHCKFLKPVFLPAQVEFRSVKNGPARDFSLSNGQNIQHLTGTFSQL